MQLVTLPNGRLAIRHADALLAVPPMHPDTRPADRTRILEYVLRRQIGLAYDCAQTAAEAVDPTVRARIALARLASETPHRNARGAVAA